MEKKYIVRLSDEERETLRAMVATGKTAAYKIRHANILLAIDAEGQAMSDEAAARAFSCHKQTIYEIRRRFVEHGFERALERKKQDHPSHERRLDGDGEAHLLKIACSKAPDGRARWTLKLLAERLVELEIVDSISDQTVRRTLKKMTSSRTSNRTG